MKTFIYAQFLLLNIVNAVQYFNCSQIPALPLPTIDEWVRNGPYDYYWGFNGQYKCAQRIFQYPKFGFNYTASFGIIQGNVIKSYHLQYQSDNTALAYPCIAGSTVVPSSILLKVVANGSTDNGCFFCGAACKDDALTNFFCYANSGKFAKDMQDFVNTIITVPSGSLIYETHQDCDKYAGCEFLN